MPAMLFAGSFYEDFHAAPDLSEGWTFGETNNVKLSSREGTSKVLDTKTSLSDERTALFVERQGDDESALVEILSPFSADCICGYSLFCKASSSGVCSDRVSAFGRTSSASAWQRLGDPVFVTGSGQWPTNAVSPSLDIHQVKFALESDVENFKNVGLDSLRVYWGEDEPSGGDDPGVPTAPGNLKLEATAPDRIRATWNGVPGKDGYRIELFQVKDTRETTIPDFTGLAKGAWPAGWTHSDDRGFDSYLDGTARNVKILYSDAWIASPCFSEPVTSFSYKYRGNSSKADEVMRTELVVEVSALEHGGDWEEVSRQAIAGTMTTRTCDMAYEKGVRRIRFSVFYDGEDRDYAANLLIEFRVLSVSSGRVTVAKKDSCVTELKESVFGDLDRSGCYRVTVCPEPSNDPSLVSTSDELDLSKERFRKIGAIVLGRDATYAESFDSLLNFVTQTKTSRMALDFWQFVLDGAEVNALGLSAGTVPQIASPYVCCDAGKTPSSYMLGTLAGGDHECAVGLAWKNGTGYPIRGLSVRFDSVQRSFRTTAATYVLEWLVTDGETSVASAGDWMSADIPATAPYTSATQGVMTEFRQNGICAAIQTKVPKGKTILLRWRHPQTTSGPMMSIDNVSVAFDVAKGFAVIVR